MQKLYGKCLEEENIRKAIVEVLKHEGSKTAGPDGINKYSEVTEERMITEAKLRLRRRKGVRSRIVEIPKGNGKTRTLTICNMFDRIAQQCVYRIIAKLLDKKFSKHSYGYRTGLCTKNALSKIAGVFNQKQKIFTVEIDFTKCFDNIPLEKAIGDLYDLGIRDPKLLKTIKHLMIISKEYKGVGLGQGTILGPLLMNCYLHKLDKFMEESFELESVDKHYSRDYRLHKNEWIEWLKIRNRKIHCRYYRYADDSCILCDNEESQKEIERLIREFINENLEITVNEEKSKCGFNKLDFLGYHFKKSTVEKESVWIRVSEPEEIIREANRFEFKTNYDCVAFLLWLRGILGYYNMVNDMSYILNKIQRRLFTRSKRRGTALTYEVTFKWRYKFRKHENAEYIDIYEMRKNTKTSFMEYLKGSKWIRDRELIMESDRYESAWRFRIWELFTIQRGKDKVTGKYLDINKMEVHHIKQRINGGTNEIGNLILIDEETHKLIHSEEKTELKKIEWYRKHLK